MAGWDEALVRFRDLAGRPRGVGFVADHHGTVVTSHETVDGLSRLVLYGAGDRSCVVTADAVTPLPDLDLALVRTEGLGVDPLPVTVRDRIETGTYVRLPAGCWREARVLGSGGVTYTATDRFRLLDDVLELAIGTAGRDALRLGGGAAGGPVLDATTGAVIGVLGTALQSGHRDVGFAVPLRPAAHAALADLLLRNAATVPAYDTDLNLAGVLELTATSVGQDGPTGAGQPDAGTSGSGWCGGVGPVERAVAAGELEKFLRGPALVLGLVGVPGSGRTTELAALAARRHRSAEPAPTLWLRGADLKDDDGSVADAAGRALARAARIVAASQSTDPADLGDITPERLAHLSRTAGRPLLLLLDGPEEMPPVLAHRLPAWSDGTAKWLRETGARLVVACRPEYWEKAGSAFSRDLLHTVHLGDLTDQEAAEARTRYRIPEGALTDARHPLTLRLYAEIHAALQSVQGIPGIQSDAPIDRDDVFSAHLDLMCLRIAVRLAAQNGLRGTAVRRLAAKVSGQVHEAARRSLGPGQGELDRQSFEAVFPWGQAPARLGGGTGWASAVLTEGLLVPAGNGYRFAHEELADWIQGMHLDLDEALRALVHRRTHLHPDRPLPVPHHRIGPVVQALLLLARQHGTPQLALRLEELVYALDADPDSWWAARLLAEVLRRVPDATPYTAVLHLLIDRVVAWRRRGCPVPAEFGPDLWTALALPHGTRFELLRRLVLADGPPHEDGPRFLDAVAALLTADPTAVPPHLTRWFDDERPLPATPDATVATAAQALLHTHRHGALDDLTEVLVDCAHARADELLAVLAEDEPSAICRAVDRWAHDERPARRVAAVAYGLRAAPHLRTEADRELLRYAALALLARPADCTLHGGALALLVRDPVTRARHLPQALGHFVAGDPQLPAGALVPALASHPDQVLDAFRARLRRPDAGEALRTLADVTTPTPARRVADLVREAVERRPESAVHVAAYVDRRLDHGPTARAVLLPLVTGLLHGGSEQVRAALATVLTASGTPASRPLRQELLEILLSQEHAPSVLVAVLHAAAARRDDPLCARGLVHRTGLLLVRTPEGAALFDRDLVDLGRHVPGFAARLVGWLTDTPQEWAAVVGPSARRMIENLAGVRVPA
ncbi:large Pro/Ala/Gly-rich protein [Streptomyces lincolnensis]|uniref:Large Pro/Ala/Gly-rich protein n=1 Tax=Streptomyces lincolnensis TaxID=1915 RepID=A0A1B1MIY1_STRLN|nr:trypsin-like peptidase domain-containing protein [Streptomyces lincolnensis]ANS68352.1 large Pro/Ala/Gly-rich protein [Streptomyces lincolnensis]AXG53444.1 large Pro/Ala/Gly-rich protein [Streptomyces lincolnensis]QMV09992.1 serine protease [Streptomyces lincolnensis]